MAELKTKQTNESVVKFLNAIENASKRKDCFELTEMMKQESKCEPKMWGSGIVGFGSYHYKYESGHEGDICLVGFAPGKQNISLYIMAGISDRQDLLERLGKHKRSKGCLYINKLSDIDITVLKELIKISIDTLKNKYG